jgi:hypothetical protein
MEPDHRAFECACGDKSYLTKDELLRHPRIQPFDRILGLRLLRAVFVVPEEGAR